MPLYNRFHQPTADEPAEFTVLLEAFQGKTSTHYILTEKFSSHRVEVYGYEYQPAPFSKTILERWGYERVVAVLRDDHRKEKRCYIPEGIWEELRAQLAPERVTYEHLCQVSPHITADVVDQIEERILDRTEEINRRTLLEFARNDADAIDHAVEMAHNHLARAKRIRDRLAQALLEGEEVTYV